eukprot:274552_1
MGNVSKIKPWAIYSLVLLCASILTFGVFFDELSINKSVLNPYNEDIMLKCGWDSITISIDSKQYVGKYSSDHSTIQAGVSYLTWISVGYVMTVFIFIPMILYYIPCCICLRCLRWIKKWKICMLRLGTLFCAVVWIIAAIDWETTEDCCEYWQEDLNFPNEYDGTDCVWYISIYATVTAAFMSLCISFYTICVWDITCFEEFNEDEYFHMV